MPPNNDTFTYCPRITFQDTNVVGNVYFLTYFRWQAECRDHWLRGARPDLWAGIRSGERQLLVNHWETRFEDPFGATIGDEVELTMSFSEGVGETLLASTEVFKHVGDVPTRIASGSMTLTKQGKLDSRHNDHPTGPCYSFAATSSSELTWNTLNLLSWQGKCRESFLADHAGQTLRRVANRDLILQTTTASIDLLQAPPPSDQARVEMRLEFLKCGQMDVRFDYFIDLPDVTPIRFAKGKQTMSSKHQRGSCTFPAELLLALRGFAQSELIGKIDDILRYSSPH